MPKMWNLDAFDNKTIYGLLDQPTSGKSDKAILIVHGMTGNPKEVLHQAVADCFSKLNYDVLRPYLYDMNRSLKNARTFQDATIAIHAKDIDTIMDHFAPQYKTIYGIGHSYGGPSILSSDTSRYKAICLEDPTFKTKKEITSSFVQNNAGKYVIEWDHSIPVGQAMYDENEELSREQCIAWARNCKAPLRVIWAGDGGYRQLGESYHNHAKTATDMKLVNGTSHCFDEPGTTEPILRYIQEWFEKFQP